MILKNLDSELAKLEISTPGWFASTISKGKWKYPLHLSILDKCLVRLAGGSLSRLIVNMPPRHGKSEFISKYFPAWYLGNFPDNRIILTSYSASFANSWGRKVRDILKIYGQKYFGIEVNPKSSSVNNFDILSQDGGMSCSGAGGSITGRGADLLIIDDPVKNEKEAHSPLIRDRIWDWFKATAFTRLEPNGALIIIMTRWHEDDLCGRIESEFDGSIVKFENESIFEQNLTDKWLLLKIPAIARTDDPLGRAEGEILWKERFPEDKIIKIRETIGEYWFSALYQQSPSPASGGIFKRQWFKYFEQNEEHYFLRNNENVADYIYRVEDCPVFVTIDLAVTTKSTSDYTVAVIFTVTPKRDILVLEVIRDKLSGAEHLDMLKNIYERFKPQLIGIECVQYQITLVQTAMSQGLPVKQLKADKDKLTRALPMEARLGAGSVYFKKNAHWLGIFEEELLQFPHGKYDDQVDAFAYINSMIAPITGVLPAAANNRKGNLKGILKGFE